VPRRRRSERRAFAVDLIFALVAIVLFYAFLNSSLPTDIGRAIASGMRFGPTPVASPSNP